MANKNISQLQELTAIVAADLLHVYDSSESEDGHRTVGDLLSDLSAALLDAAQNWSADQNFQDNILQRPELKDYAETRVEDTDSGASHTIDLENGNVHDLVLTANCTLTFSNPPASGKSGSFALFLRQDGTGSRTVTWPASVKWASGSAPTLSTDANAMDALSFVTLNGGATWFGFVAGQDIS